MSLETKAALLHFAIFFLQFCLWQAVHSALTYPKNVYYQLTKPLGRTFSEIACMSLCPKMTTSFVCEVPRYPGGTLVNDHRQKAVHLTVHQSRGSGKSVLFTEKETMTDREAKAAADQYSVS